MDYNSLKKMVYRPLIPKPDNFTPKERTPWGGIKIPQKYKKWLNLPKDLIVGESWEISGHPTFPSKFILPDRNEKSEITLPELLQLFPKEILGETLVAKFNHQIPIMIKLLDATKNLSVQVHPDDGYIHLSPSETGKTEAWYIVEAEPGCGLYLGIRENVTPVQLRKALERGEDISIYLNFVPVHAGEMYFIAAGTIHAIGKGVTLIEPQQTSQITYRFWDWNHRYNEKGEFDINGKPRPLHIEDSFAVTNFNTARGQQFIKQMKAQPRLIHQDHENMVFLLLRKKHFVIEKVTLNETVPFKQSKPDVFQTLTVISGEVDLTFQTIGKEENVIIPMGQSVLIPAVLNEISLRRHSTEVAEIIKVHYPL